VVSVDHPAWATQVRRLGDELLDRVADGGGVARPNRVEVRVRANRPGFGADHRSGVSHLGATLEHWNRGIDRRLRTSARRTEDNLVALVPDQSIDVGKGAPVALKKEERRATGTTATLRRREHHRSGRSRPGAEAPGDVHRIDGPDRSAPSGVGGRRQRGGRGHGRLLHADRRDAAGRRGVRVATTAAAFPPAR
jgi:hypothetical protein